MPVLIEFLEEEVAGRLTALDDVGDHAWARVKDAILQFEPAAQFTGRSVTVPWRTVAAAAPELAEIRRRTSTAFSYDEGARRQLLKFRDESRRIRELRDGAVTAPIARDDIPQRLAEKGFTKRQLTSRQLDCVEKLLRLPHGANFSVPGAGKTTVALATHLLGAANARLLVVAPKNAFSAWDEVLDDCLDPVGEPFVRLTGSPEAIRNVLMADEPPGRLIISYDQLIRSLRQVYSFLTHWQTHVILDESHRIKAGRGSQRGQASLSLANLAVRRDILSGTPVPNGILDLTPQLDFLWPGQSLGRRVAEAARPVDVLGPYYVRITKSELGLGPVTKNYVPVPMTPAQTALYGLIRDELLKVEVGLRSNPSSIDLDSARRSVLSLLQVSSSPILLIRRLTAGHPEDFPHDNAAVEGVFAAVFDEADSQKIREACRIARQLAAQGKKVVIWSTFTDTVERIAELLEDVGATFIHGGIDTGDEADLDTREGRLALFKRPDSDCMVLVANPAACSEGISLHHVCHHAIYVDRSFNAGHFLQSIDRIHRLGLPVGTETHVYILESVTPQHLGSIDHSVRRRMIVKLRTMAAVLDDRDLHRLMLDEDEAEAPIDFDVSRADILDVIDELKGQVAAPGEEDI